MTVTRDHTDATEMRAPDLLRSAARLIEMAIIKLDMTERRTDCDCGHRHYVNKVDARAYERLTNTPEKLRAVAVMLTTGSEPDAQQLADARK